MIIPPEIHANTHDKASWNIGSCRKNTFTKEAIKITTAPANKNLPQLIKFLFGLSEKADNNKKIKPVEPKAIIISSLPLLKVLIYRFNIGPRVYPNNPVRAKVKRMPQPLFLVACTANNSAK